MDAKRCDRCGTFYTETDFPVVTLYGYVSSKKQITEVGNNLYSADLCPGCWESFGNWWNKGE